MALNAWSVTTWWHWALKGYNGIMMLSLENLSQRQKTTDDNSKQSSHSHRRPKLAEIRCLSFFTRLRADFSCPIKTNKPDGIWRAAVDVYAFNFDHLTPKSNQHLHIYDTKYACDQNLASKFPSLIFEIRCSQGFWDAQSHRHTWKQYRKFSMAKA